MVVCVKPKSESGTAIAAQDSGPGVLTPMYFDLAGNVPIGQLYPRLRDLNTSGFCSADISATSWPTVLAYTVSDTESTLYVDGTAATVYDGRSARAAIPFGADNVSFGNNFVSTSTWANLYCYALFYSTVLTAQQVADATAYCKALVALRGVPLGGPATFTTNLLAFVGNSLTQGLDKAKITPTGTWDRISSHIYGGSPEAVVAKANQSIRPLFRPQAAKNVLQLWPSPNGTAQQSYDAAVALCGNYRDQGWRVSLVTAISATGYDATKNELNALYEAQGYGPSAGSLADALCRVNDLPEADNDGASANTTFAALPPSSSVSFFPEPAIAD
jgi:hypothetical protein